MSIMAIPTTVGADPKPTVLLLFYRIQKVFAYLEISDKQQTAVISSNTSQTTKTI